ncbi:MAG: DNA methyltransferase [Desulfobaccales bacterium]|nr:DNA methyltransferase [Desulfobaccales bacterium]
MDILEELQQLYLFKIDKVDKVDELDSRLWRGSFSGRESTLQQLSPYVGKMKSGMARALIKIFTEPNDIILDPFSGSGVVPLEALLANRIAFANDLSPYAYVLTRGKLEAPASEKVAIKNTLAILDEIIGFAPKITLSSVPQWVKEFYHPDTLRETLATFKVLMNKQNYFLMACLLGILHHVRPGFLSFPASHLVPYLRKAKYPVETFPWMYEYRDVKSRLVAKVKRAYKRTLIPDNWDSRNYKLWNTNSMQLPIDDNQIDAIISSPPYFGALDYARDNRLRLWFLGHKDWKKIDETLTANGKIYLPQMAICLKEIYRVLKPGKYCILVLGDVERNGKTKKTAEILSELAVNVTDGKLIIDKVYDDIIPDERRSRRRTTTTKFERILVMHKI